MTSLFVYITQFACSLLVDFWFIVNYFLSRMKQFGCFRWGLSVFPWVYQQFCFICFSFVLFSSHSSTGWSSQSDVSISTEPHSELSTGTGQTSVHHDKWHTDNISITQVGLMSHIALCMCFLPQLLMLLFAFFVWTELLMEFSVVDIKQSLKFEQWRGLLLFQTLQFHKQLDWV